MRKFLGAMLAIATLTWAPGAALAGVLLNTGTPVNPNLDWSLFRVGNLDGQNLAAQFEVGVGGATITGIEGYVNGLGTFSISVASNAGGNVPLSTILSPVQATSNSETGAWSGVNNLNLHLAQGLYWAIFSVRPDLGDTFGGGMYNNAPNPAIHEAFFEIPEFQWINYDDLNIGVRVYDDTVTAGVPEPAAWTLMILGFGAAGAALRRRSRANARI